MCKFFSCVSDGHGSIRYFSAEERTEINEKGNPKHYSFDSHSSICRYFEINEDKCNKYEYCPFTKKFVVDILNNIDDSAHVEKQVRNLDFTDIFKTGLFRIDLSELESLDGIVLPKKYRSINLSSIKKLENFTFPKKCEYVDLERCTEIKNVVFLKIMKDYLDLRSLKSLDNVILPEKYSILYLNSIESKDFEIPEKHGEIHLKDKNVYSNY